MSAPNESPPPDPPPGPRPDEIRPWPERGRREGPDLFVARVRWDLLVNPRTGAEMERTVLETPDWVNVVAVTATGELVFVHQYRFGTSAVSCEIPGGVLDPGEDHRAAAERELREETGYTAPRWTYLGSCEPNPTYQTNVCHTWLAEDATRTHPLELDPGEDLAVELVAREEVLRRVHAGEVAHSLILVALARVMDLRAP